MLRRFSASANRVTESSRRFRNRKRLLAFLVCASSIAAVAAVSCSRNHEQSLQRARDAWDSGNYKEAADSLEHYLERNPSGDESIKARLQLANIYYFNLHRYEPARAQYAAILEQDPAGQSVAIVRQRLAEVLAELGRSYEAIAEYETLNPSDALERRRVRLQIADLYFDQKNYSQALTEYEKVTEGTPYDDLSEQAYLREASIYHITRGQYQQAVLIYDKLAAESTDAKVQKRALYGLAECYAGLYQFDLAIKALRGIKDEGEQSNIARRISDLEQQKRDAAQARSGLRGSEK